MQLPWRVSANSGRYNLQRAGLGPDEILVGSHRRITAENRRRWHKTRERAAKQRQQKIEEARV
jgi:hypothetical protein